MNSTGRAQTLALSGDTPPPPAPDGLVLWRRARPGRGVFTQRSSSVVRALGPSAAEGSSSPWKLMSPLRGAALTQPRWRDVEGNMATSSVQMLQPQAAPTGRPASICWPGSSNRPFRGNLLPLRRWSPPGGPGAAAYPRTCGTGLAGHVVVLRKGTVGLRPGGDAGETSCAGPGGLGGRGKG